MSLSRRARHKSLDRKSLLVSSSFEAQNYFAGKRSIQETGITSYNGEGTTKWSTTLILAIKSKKQWCVEMMRLSSSWQQSPGMPQ